MQWLELFPDKDEVAGSPPDCSLWSLHVLLAHACPFCRYSGVHLTSYMLTVRNRLQLPVTCKAKAYKNKENEGQCSSLSLLAIILIELLSGVY